MADPPPLDPPWPRLDAALAAWEAAAIAGSGGGSATPDADATTKGKVQLAGDLAGAGSAAATPKVSGIGGVAVTVDTDGTLAGNSDAKLATQKAAKTYADTKLPKTGGTMSGAVAMGSNKITGATPGAAAGEVATFDQLSVLTGNNQTGTTYTLVLADAGKVVECNNGSAVTLTIPTNASVAFPVGTVIEVFQQGVGQVTIAAAGGVNLRSDGSKVKITGQYGTISLRQRATDEWVLSGDLSA